MTSTVSPSSTTASIAASILITQVSTDHAASAKAGEPDDGGLGGRAWKQFLGMPKALILAAAALFCLGVVPGLPLVQFWFVAGLLAIPGISGLRAPKQVAGPDYIPAFEVQPALELALPTAALSADESAQARRQIIMFISKLGTAWGAPFPMCSFTQRSLPEAKTVVLFRAGLRIAERSVEELMALVGEELTYRPARYFGVDQARQWFEKVSEQDPALVESVLAMVKVESKETGREYRYAVFSAVLSALLEERVPIRDARAILRQILQSGLADSALIDRIRMALHESSAQFYRERYRITEHFVLDSVLLQLLESDTPGEALVDSIEIFFRGRLNGPAMIQAPDRLRRRLWEQIERKLYEPGRLPYPIVVIGQAENPASKALQIPKAAVEIPLQETV